MHSKWADMNPVYGQECSFIRINGSVGLWYSANCSDKHSLVCGTQTGNKLEYVVPRSTPPTPQHSHGESGSYNTVQSTEDAQMTIAPVTSGRFVHVFLMHKIDNFKIICCISFFLVLDWMIPLVATFVPLSVVAVITVIAFLYVKRRSERGREQVFATRYTFYNENIKYLLPYIHKIHTLYYINTNMLFNKFYLQNI